MVFAWTCPICDRDSIVTDTNCMVEAVWFGLDNAHGKRMVQLSFIVCPNPKCREFTLTAQMFAYASTTAGTKIGSYLGHWNLVPPSKAKVFPAYVPQPIRDDYVEACLVRDLSPKASATLARRCLQGMIRDYWGIQRARLSEEIAALEGHVDPLSWQAIDAVRSIGNIGAHMEKDINLIIDVEPDGASKLVELIELLIRDWYIARHDREQRLREIVAIKEAKEKAKADLEENKKPEGGGNSK